MKQYSVPSVHRAFELLRILAGSSRALGVTELSERTGWPKSSIYNILATLVADGYVVQEPENGRYRMTVKLFSLSGAIVERMDVRRLARPLLEELVERTGETVNLGILDGSEAIYLETIAGPGAIRVNTWPGKRLPIHSTALGKVLVADLPDAKVSDIVAEMGLTARTPNTHTTLAALQEDLAQVRKQGWALDDEEDELGMRCVGAAVRDYAGDVVGAISVTAIAQRLQRDDVDALAQIVTDYARRLSEQLGYTPELSVNGQGSHG